MTTALAPLSFVFEGSPLLFQSFSKGFGVRAGETREFLGYKTTGALRNARERTQKVGEFRSGEVWFESASSGHSALNPRGEWIYGPYALLRLAMKAETDRGARCRDFVLYEVLPTYFSARTSAAFVTPDQLAAAIRSAVAEVASHHAEAIAAKDRRIDALVDSQATLAHAFADQVKAGSRALTTYRDSPELAALDREYHRRHDPTSDLFGSPHGPDATYEALKARALEALRSMTAAGPVFARRLPRELACVLAMPRRHARDVVGDLYAEGAIRRRAGQIVVTAPASKQVAGGANGVNRLAAVASGNGNGNGNA